MDNCPPLAAEKAQEVGATPFFLKSPD